MAARSRTRPTDPPPQDPELDPDGGEAPQEPEEVYERALPPRFDPRDEYPGAPDDLWGNPRPRASQRVESLIKPMVDGDYSEAEVWRVERMNKANGRAESVGDIHIDCTEPEFIQRFLSSMPEVGEEATIFRLIPITRSGTRLSNEPVVKRIAADHVTLMQMKAAADLRNPTGLPGLVSPGGGDTAVLAMLREQLKAQADRMSALEEKKEAADAKAEKEREALVNQRIALAAATAEDMGANFKKIGDATHVMYASVNEMQTKAAEAALARQATLAAEERQRIKDEREREKEERANELALKLAAIKADADQRKAELALEQTRIIEAARERRADEAERRKEDDARRSEERLERAKLDAAMETARAERAAAEDKRRDEHAKSMEAMRQEARQDAEKRMDAMRADEKDYAARRDALIQQQLAAVTANHAAAVNPLAPILDMLAPLGFTPTVLAETFKGMMGGGGGGVLQTLIEQVGGVVQKMVEQGAGDPDGDPDDPDGDEPDEPDEMTEAEQIAEDRARQAATRAAAQARTRALPGPTVNAGDLVPRGPAAAEPVPAAGQAPVAAATPAAATPAIDMTVQREGRAGLATLWAKLQDTPDEGWQAAIHEATAYGSTAGVSKLLAYLVAAGSNAALGELEIPEPALAKLLPILASMNVKRGPTL
jgi:hypothetical protein